MFILKGSFLAEMKVTPCVYFFIQRYLSILPLNVVNLWRDKVFDLFFIVVNEIRKTCGSSKSALVRIRGFSLTIRTKNDKCNQGVFHILRLQRKLLSN